MRRNRREPSTLTAIQRALEKAGATGTSAGAGVGPSTSAGGGVGSDSTISNGTNATLGTTADLSGFAAMAAIVSNRNHPGARLARLKHRCAVIRAHSDAYDADIARICAALAQRQTHFAGKRAVGLRDALR